MQKSIIYKFSPKFKLSSLMILGTIIFLISNLYFLISSFLIVSSLYFIAKFSLKKLFIEIRKILFFLIIIFFVHLFVDTWLEGLISIMRFSTLFLFSSLITLTTKTSAIIESIECFIKPLSIFGLNHKKVALAISLGLRFIPLLKEIYHEVLIAQKARGINKNTISLIVPIIIRSLKMADNIADAIEARS